MARSPAVRALGTGHSFNAIADTDGVLLSTADLPATLVLDPDTDTVTVGAGLRFGEFTGVLHEAGRALHNFGSLPHISVAGACATGTHGSGTGNGTLASAVRALELVTADGSLRRIEHGDPDFPGSVVSLGALGVVTRLTLATVPAFDVRQAVYENLPHAQLREAFAEVMASAYSVSLFTGWRGPLIEQVWLKHRVEIPDPSPLHERWLGAVLADGPRHPVPAMPARSCTPQGGSSGPWHARLPHFRLEHTPSSGAELQSEFFVASEHAVAAFDALHRVRRGFAPRLQIGEIRTVAADEHWLSPAQGRPTTAFHFTWLPGESELRGALRVVEEALAPFDARPHWGKLFGADAGRLRALYPRHGDFERLLFRHDPSGKFRNAYVRRLFPGAG